MVWHKIRSIQKIITMIVFISSLWKVVRLSFKILYCFKLTLAIFSLFHSLKYLDYNPIKNVYKMAQVYIHFGSIVKYMYNFKLNFFHQYFFYDVIHFCKITISYCTQIIFTYSHKKKKINKNICLKFWWYWTLNLIKKPML